MMSSIFCDIAAKSFECESTSVSVSGYIELRFAQCRERKEEGRRGERGRKRKRTRKEGGDGRWEMGDGRWENMYLKTREHKSEQFCAPHSLAETPPLQCQSKVPMSPAKSYYFLSSSSSSLFFFLVICYSTIHLLALLLPCLC